MGFRKIDDETRRAAAAEALGGRPVTEVAVRYGVSEQSVRNWSSAVLEERRRAARKKPDGRRVAKVTLVEVEFRGGRVLALANVGRGGEPTGTLQRIAGAPVGADGVIHGRLARKWTVDAVHLRNLVDGVIANMAV